MPPAPPSNFRYFVSYLHLPGYIVATFTPAVQLSFVTGIAAQLAVPVSTVSITAITANVPAAAAGRHLLQSAGAVNVQFQVQTTQGAYRALSNALSTTLFDDSLLAQLAGSGLPLLMGPIVPLQSTAISSTPLPALFAAPSPPPTPPTPSPPSPPAPPATHYTDTVSTRDFGLGIGLGLGIPVAVGLCCIAYQVRRSCCKQEVKNDDASSASGEEAAPKSPQRKMVMDMDTV